MCTSDLEDRLANMILEDKIKDGDEVFFDTKNSGGQIEMSLSVKKR